MQLFYGCCVLFLCIVTPIADAAADFRIHYDRSKSSNFLQTFSIFFASKHGLLRACTVVGNRAAAGKFSHVIRKRDVEEK